VLRAGEAAENAKVETKKAVIYSSKARVVRTTNDNVILFKEMYL